SPLQQGLYVEAARHDGTDASVDVYVTQSVIRLDGDQDADRLRRAAARLLQRHRVLRSGFVQPSSGALAVVVPDSVEIPWRTVDLSGEAVAAAGVLLDEIAVAERVERFDLAAPPLIRFVLATLPGESGPRAALIVTNHHLLFDGWSGPLVLADLIEGYVVDDDETRSSATDYADFLDWLYRQDRAAAVDAWRDELSIVDGPTLVSTGAAATVQEMPAEHAVFVGPDTARRLEEFARTSNVTLSTVVQFAWGVLLSRMTGQDTVTFGETVSGRPPEIDGVESMIGLFINTLPVAVSVGSQTTIADAVRALQESKTRLLDHQHLGLPQIAAAVGEVGFDTLTIFESYPIDGDAVADGSRAAGLQIAGIDFTDATHYPLNLFSTPTGDDLGLNLKYLPSAFTADEIAGFAAAVVAILGHVVEGPDTVIGDIDLLSAPARAAALVRAAGDEVAVRPQTVDALIAAQIAATPDRTALVVEDRVVDYREFGAR
ncbi:non-ribosomal peptide synthetase, partial [Streptomyces sp. SID10244]|nr:non-ribosomal peptide synthetase [Streptomyces sp. SID10244]